MSKWEIVRRPALEPHDGDGPDPARDWRAFVLGEVGYGPDGRPLGWRPRIDWRGFAGGLLKGALLYALTFAVVLTSLYWRDGAFDGVIAAARHRALAAPDRPAPPPRPGRSSAADLPRSATADWPDPYAPPRPPAPHRAAAAGDGRARRRRARHPVRILTGQRDATSRHRLKINVLSFASSVVPRRSIHLPCPARR